MNGQPETPELEDETPELEVAPETLEAPELEVSPTLTAAHVRTWSRVDWRTKTTHTVPLVQALTWSPHDVIRVNGL